MFINELRMTIPAQKQAEVIKPRYHALQFHAVDEENRQGNLALPNLVQKCILKVLCAFCRHFFTLFVFAGAYGLTELSFIAF